MLFITLWNNHILQIHTFILIYLSFKKIIFFRLSAYPTATDRSSLLRSHAAKSAECSGQGSPKARRIPRESRRVSLAQASGYVQLNQYRLLEPIGQVTVIAFFTCIKWKSGNKVQHIFFIYIWHIYRIYRVPVICTNVAL